MFDVSHFMHLHVALRDLFGENGWDPSLPDELIPFVSQFSFSDESDYMVWEPTSSGLFTLHSAYNLLRPKQASLPSMRFVWSKRVPTKISFFAWRLLNGLLPFADILVSRYRNRMG